MRWPEDSSDPEQIAVFSIQPLHKPITKKGIYFITFTCYKWLALIEKTNCYDTIYGWFDILKKKPRYFGFCSHAKSFAFAIVLFCGARNLNFEIGEAKRFIAYEIIKRLKKSKENFILSELGAAVQMKDKTRGKLHKVWKDSFDCEECRTENLSCRSCSTYIIIRT